MSEFLADRDAGYDGVLDVPDDPLPQTGAPAGPVCVCGDLLDDHWGTGARPCAVDGCPCLAFEEDDR